MASRNSIYFHLIWVSRYFKVKLISVYSFSFVSKVKISNLVILWFCLEYALLVFKMCVVIFLMNEHQCLFQLAMLMVAQVFASHCAGGVASFFVAIEWCRFDNHHHQLSYLYSLPLLSTNQALTKVNYASIAHFYDPNYSACFC